MKLVELISKSSQQILAGIIIPGAILTAAAFFVKPLAPYTPIISAAIGAGVFYAINRKNLQGIESVMLSSKTSVNKVVEEAMPEILDATGDFEELKSLKGQLRQIAKRIEASLQDLDYEKKLHKSDLAALSKIFEKAGKSESVSLKMEAILKVTAEYCNFKDFYLFLKDPDEDLLYRANPKKDERAPLEFIPFYDDHYLPFLKTLENGTPEYIMKIKTDTLLDKIVKDWSEHNQIRMIYCAPIFLEQIPWGLILFSLDEREELDEGQKAVIRIASDIIGSFQREEIELLEMKRKQEQQESELMVFQTLVDSRDIKELCINFILAVKDYIPIDWGAISVPDPEKETHRMFSLDVHEREKGFKLLTIPGEGSGVSWVRDNEKMWADDDLKIKKPFMEDEIFSLEGLSSRIILPVSSHDQFVGAIAIASKESSVYTTIHSDLLLKVAHVMGPVLEILVARETLDTKIEELQESNGKLEAFYDTMGHELRHSINILHKIAYTVKKEAEKLSSGQIKKTFNFVSDKVKDLYKSIEDVLDYSRARAGKMEYNPRDFFVMEFNDLLWEFEEKARKQQVNLKWEIPADMPEIIGDVDKLRGMLKELIGNSLKHTPASGWITVMASFIPQAWLAYKADTYFPPDILAKIDITVDHVLFTVTDTGSGIPEDKRKNLFKSAIEAPEKYSSNMTKGLGLGLPLVKKLVEVHKGVIWYATKEGKGSRFSFNIPQYGKDWADLHDFIHERIERARQDLTCLTVVAITLKDLANLKQRFEMQEVFNLINEMEQRARKVLRDPLDVVRRHYNRETILVACRADVDQVEAIKRRLAETFQNLKSFIPEEMIDFEYFSLTYPDEALDAGSILAGIDNELVKFSRT